MQDGLMITGRASVLDQCDYSSHSQLRRLRSNKEICRYVESLPHQQ